MKNIVYGLCGGFILYIPFALSGYTIYLPKMFENTFSSFDLAYYLVGSFIAIFTITYKNKTFKHALLRTLFLLIGLSMAIVINGEIGTLRIIDELLKISESDANSRAAGLVSVIWLIAMLLVCLVTNAAVLVRRLLRTGDGLREPY